MRKYNICITLDGQPFPPHNKPLSKRYLPRVNGVISFYTRVSVFDAKTGAILGTGHSPIQLFESRMDFLKARPWRCAIRRAVPKARARLAFLALKQVTIGDRRKKHT